MTDHDTAMQTHLYGGTREPVHPDPFIQMGRELARTEAVPPREPYSAPIDWRIRSLNSLPDEAAMSRWLLRNLSPDQADAWLRRVHVEVARLAGEDVAQRAREAME